MAEFCTNCAGRYGMEIDIPIASIFEKLKNGETESVLCEGCELIGIEKTEEGKMKLHYIERDNTS